MSFHSELHAARISPRAEWEREHFGPAVLPQDVEETMSLFTHELAYIGHLPRRDLEHTWRVTITSSYSNSISFFYFATKEEALAIYPDAIEVRSAPDHDPIFVSGLIADPIPDDPGEDLWYRDADGEIGVVLTDAEVEAMGGYDEGEMCVECHHYGGHAMGCLAA